MFVRQHNGIQKNTCMRLCTHKHTHTNTKSIHKYSASYSCSFGSTYEQVWTYTSFSQHILQRTYTLKEKNPIRYAATYTRAYEHVDEANSMCQPSGAWCQWRSHVRTIVNHAKFLRTMRELCDGKCVGSPKTNTFSVKEHVHRTWSKCTRTRISLNKMAFVRIETPTDLATNNHDRCISLESDFQKRWLVRKWSAQLAKTRINTIGALDEIKITACNTF